MNARIDMELHRGTAGGERPGSVVRALLSALASLRMTLTGFVLLGLGVVMALQVPALATWAIVLPLTGCAVNLLAALAVHPALRRHLDLLVFHLALLAIILLVALGRLTYFKGQAELSTGETFRGKLVGYKAGPWHGLGIRHVRFDNLGFTIDYEAGRQRAHTFNTVRYTAEDGRAREVVIGDQVPLVLDGYRFYTSFNKGFALTLVWKPDGGRSVQGTVHLPGYPLNEYRQANTWTPPGGKEALWLQLRFDEPLLDPKAPAQFRTPKAHWVVVRQGERRVELTPGKSLRLDGGTLTYEGVGTWMGYTINYDRTIPWLLAACVVAVLSLGWFYTRRHFMRPWVLDSPPGEENP